MSSVTTAWVLQAGPTSSYEPGALQLDHRRELLDRVVLAVDHLLQLRRQRFRRKAVKAPALVNGGILHYLVSRSWKGPSLWTNRTAV